MPITSEELEIIQSTVREFVENELKPLSAKIDAEASIPQDLFEKLSSLGLFGILCPQEYGGAGADFDTMMAVTSELAKACASTTLVILTHNLACQLLAEFGSKEQKARLIPHLASGKKIGTVAITEGLSSLDLKSIKTFSVQNENSFTLDGTKPTVVNGSFADVFIVLSRTSAKDYQFLIVEKNSKGFEQGEKIKIFGVRAAGISPIYFDEINLPKEDSLGTKEDATTILRFAQEYSWLGYASIGIGIGRAALEASIKYSKQRTQFGKPIGEFEAIRDIIIVGSVSVETLAALMKSLAETRQQGKSVWVGAAAAKLEATRMAKEAGRNAIRIHGGYGFIKDYPVERYARDGKALEILGDMNEDLKVLVAEDALHRDDSQG